MRIEPTPTFEKALKFYKKSNPAVLKRLDKFMDCKFNGNPLPNSYREHGLKGELSHLMECHLLGDVLLIYKVNHDSLQLLTICNHDDLKTLGRKFG